jgi:hypothetical protein
MRKNDSANGLTKPHIEYQHEAKEKVRQEYEKKNQRMV